MLLQKSITVNDIVSIKLITGDELIAKLTAVGQDSISISKPLVVTIGMDERTGQVGIQMSPYFVLCASPDANITLKNIHILVYTLANDGAKSGYIQNTTGLTLASSRNNGLIT
jgi:hypothetical protein